MFQDDNCRFRPRYVGATDTGFVDINEGDEEALKQAVATVGPVSVAIDASHQSFQFYSTGVCACLKFLRVNRSIFPDHVGRQGSRLSHTLSYPSNMYIYPHICG